MKVETEEERHILWWWWSGGYRHSYMGEELFEREKVDNTGDIIIKQQ